MNITLIEPTPITQKIINFLDNEKIKYKRILHQECRTSQESSEARAQGGGGIVIGAKAILMKVDRKEVGTEFHVFVLPGEKQIDSKVLKKALKAQFNDFARFRFSTTNEMSEITGGLIPGTMPPFGKPIFENIAHLFIDSTLLEHEIIGFNAACLTQSLIISTQDYLKVAFPSKILSFTA